MNIDVLRCYTFNIFNLLRNRIDFSNAGAISKLQTLNLTIKKLHVITALNDIEKIRQHADLLFSKVFDRRYYLHRLPTWHLSYLK